MATGININPDVSSLKKAFGDLRNEAAQTQAAIGKSLDTSEAADSLKKLEASAKSLKKALTGLGDKAAVEVDVKQADAALSGLKKKVDDLSGSKTAPARKPQAITDEERLHVLRKSHANQEHALKRKLQEQQARDADRAFKNYSRSNPHLRQFESFGDFLNRGKSQYGGDFDRVKRETLAYVQKRAGIGGGVLGGHQMQRAGRVAGALGGIAGGMIGGAGSGGLMGTTGSMVGTGLGAAVGMMGGPLGMIGGALIGNLASSALGGIGRQVDEAMAESVKQGVKNAGLTRAFGDVTTGFEQIRDATRDATRGMQVSYSESAEYASAYARNAAMKSPDGLRESLRDAYGFGRGLGVGQGAGVSFLSSMRGTGAAGDEKSARRIGLSVAEAIQRGGLGPQADEVLQAVQNFAQSSSQANFRSPDVGAFASLLSSGSNLKLPGLNASNMASIIQNADSAIRVGGGVGQASQIVSFDAMSSLNNTMSVYEAERLQQGGAFSTLGKTFGRSSAAWAEAQNRHDKATRDGDAGGIQKAKADMARLDELSSGPNAGVTMLEAQLRRLRAISSSTPEAMAGSARHLGMTQDQVSALFASMDSAGGMGALTSRIRRAGIADDKINMSAGMTMMRVAGGKDADVRSMANRLLTGKDFKKLDGTQEATLRKAMQQGTEPLRDAVLQTLNQVGGPMSDGDRAQQTQLDMKDAMIRMADKLVPLTTDMKDGIVALVEKLAPESDFSKRMKVARERADNEAHYAAKAQASGSGADPSVMAGYDERIAAARRAGDNAEVMRLSRERRSYFQNTRNTGGASGDWTVEADGRAGASSSDAAKQGKGPARVRSFVEQYTPYAEAAGKKLGVAPHVLLGQWGLETGWGKSVIPGTNNLGNIKDPTGKGPRAYDKREGSYDSYRAYSSPDDFAEDYARLISKKRYRTAMGSGDDAQGYFSKIKAGGYATDPAYVSSGTAAANMALRAMTPTSQPELAQTPEPPSGARSGGGTVKTEVVITVKDDKGRKRDDVKAEVTKNDYRPVPEGAF